MNRTAENRAGSCSRSGRGRTSSCLGTRSASSGNSASRSISGFAAISAPMAAAIGNVQRRTHTRRRTRLTTRSLKPSSAIAGARNSASSFLSSSSFIRSTILMTFDVKALPYLILPAEDDRFDGTYRHPGDLADLAMGHAEAVGHDHHRELFLVQHREELAQVAGLLGGRRR